MLIRDAWPDVPVISKPARAEEIIPLWAASSIRKYNDCG
jgi:hypothetical protein